MEQQCGVRTCIEHTCITYVCFAWLNLSQKEMTRFQEVELTKYSKEFNFPSQFFGRSNNWMRLSMMERIMHIDEDGINRGG